MLLDGEDEGVERCLKDLLSFYGVELQSHAGQVVGLTVVMFAVVQAWGQLASVKPSLLTPFHPWLFSVVVGTLGLLIVYEMLRLIIFGKLASAVISCSESEFTKHKGNYENTIRNKIGFPDWSELSNLRKANVYASAVLKEGLGLLLALRVFTINQDDEFKGVVRSFWILALGFALAFAFSYNFIFGSFDWGSLVALVIGSFVVLKVTHYVFWTIVKRSGIRG